MSKLTSRNFKKKFKQRINNNPKAMKENKKILAEIGRILDEDISDDELFYEAIELSPADHKTKQIVIRAPHDIIRLLDRFLIDNGVIALKERTSLRIDYLH